MKEHAELSTPAILSVAAVFAVVGLLVYSLAMPIAPAKRIQMAFSAIEQAVTR